jgi:peptide/nickel transport system permease protein
MFKIIRDLFRYNEEFAVGAILTSFGLSWRLCRPFHRIRPTKPTWCPPDIPPSWQYFFGTTSRGQDPFWQVTFALRNSLLFGFSVAFVSRILSLLVGLETSGNKDSSREFTAFDVP